MNTLKFKTNINCNGCIANVTPFLNQKEGLIKWEVNIANPDKILTVETDNLTEDEIILQLKNAGYKAEKIK
jgi:copper chaperone